ncbi:hypothetical protein PATA110616_02185 [Paenibacillus tarimensis]
MVPEVFRLSYVPSKGGKAERQAALQVLAAVGRHE